VDSNVVRALMVTRQGRVYSESELFASQANLYRSDLFRLAAVSLDSTVWDPQDTIVPLVVRVSESLRYRARASMGYATQDCFRTSAGIARRNFLGAGRILDVSGRLSKLGVGAPTDLGLQDGFLCQALKEDSIGSSKLNYNVTASVKRPAFLSPKASITVSAFSERRSEFRIYLREDIGSSIAVTRESNVWRDPITLSYTFSYGRTQATPAVFCSYFNACTAETRSLQEQRRPLAILGLRAIQTRVNDPVEPGRGHVYLGEFAWSSTLIGSSEFQQFTRLVGEARWYSTLMRGVVLATRARAGMVFGGGISSLDVPTFIPVEHRFYGRRPERRARLQLQPARAGGVCRGLGERAARRHHGRRPGQRAGVRPRGRQLARRGATSSCASRRRSSARCSRFALFADRRRCWQRGTTAPTAAGLPHHARRGRAPADPVGPFRLDSHTTRTGCSRACSTRTAPMADLIEVQDPVAGGPYQYQKPDR
jgi:hypothetical protein